MFLLRSVFWLGLVLLVLPVDRQAAGIEDGPGALATLLALQTTVQDVRGFCGRNPQACETGAATVDVMRQKAVYSAGLVQTWLGAEGAVGDQPSPGTVSASGDRPATQGDGANADPVGALIASSAHPSAP